MISGTVKGHKLKTLKGTATRPTSDSVKESMFNIIAKYLGDADVLDLYAGTGNLGIEALSRGARFCIFVDSSKESCHIIEENLVHTKLIDKAKVINDRAESVLRRTCKETAEFDIIFIDPPYGKNLIPEILGVIEQRNMVKENGVIVAQHDKRDIVPEPASGLNLARVEKYGGTVLSFYRKAES